MTAVVGRVSGLATVNVASAVTSISLSVASGSDGAEESSSGSISLNSTDIDLTLSGGSFQKVGLRFNGIGIPQGANITNAKQERHRIITGSGKRLAES